jgi:hypothetical protein
MPQVQCYVYDISQGMAKQMSMALVGKQVDYIPHTGVVVFGNEYFFASTPTIGVPGQTVGIPTCEVLNLGETTKTREELEAYINSQLVKEFNEENYTFLTHNCNHYADAVAKFLLNGTGLPSKIVNIAEEALSEPKAQPLRVMIENMEKSMRGQMGGGSAMNPFGNPAAASGAPMMPNLAGVPGMPPVAPAAVPAAAEENADLQAALSELAAADKEAQRACLSTLVKITENIEKNPGDVKFRKIKTSNAAFAKKIVSCSGGVEAMLAVGWTPDTEPDGEDVWVLGDHAGSQAEPLKQLSAALAKLGPAPGAKPAVQQTQPTSSSLGGGVGAAPGGFGGYGGMGGGMPPGGMPGLPPGMANNPMMQQMMSNPAMMQQAQQMMQNPQMMAQAQQMMQNPQMMAQMQQMMSDPNAMAQMQNMMGGAGRGGGFGM